jgi:hypothetical protein
MDDARTPLPDVAFLDTFFDVVIPPSEDGRLPGAGSIGVTAEVLARIAADPVLGAAVQEGLRAVYDAALERDAGGFAAMSAEARVALVEAQLAAHPMLIVGTVLHLYQAYYQHPRVLEGLGEPPRPPFPEGYDLEPTDPHLLEKLRQRARAAGSV